MINSNLCKCEDNILPFGKYKYFIPSLKKEIYHVDFKGQIVTQCYWYKDVWYFGIYMGADDGE